MKKVSWIVLIFVFAVLNIGSAVILFSPAREWVQARFAPEGQKMLSVVYGDLMHNGSSVKVVKFKTITSIVLEFYSESQNGSRYLVSRVEIPNAKDGFLIIVDRPCS